MMRIPNEIRLFRVCRSLKKRQRGNDRILDNNPAMTGDFAVISSFWNAMVHWGSTNFISQLSVSRKYKSSKAQQDHASSIDDILRLIDYYKRHEIISTHEQ